ncbi:addiction module antidote protein [Elongatibacter sediminis]|uniref:Addiction module antidote protein n=1 Tax=Elongatibacter sediminis TaxID=3119006 RepID=A0AAW9RFV9_9GAMM
MTTQTRDYDVARHLRNEEEMAAYLEACLAECEGDPSLVAKALGDIARARGMSDIARETGLGRESLYKALSIEGNPQLGTVLKVIQALGLKWSIRPSYANRLTTSGAESTSQQSDSSPVVNSTD